MTTTAASLITNPLFIATGTNGQPLAGGQLYTYEAGTNIPLATYTNATLTVPNTNPTILDAYGSAQVWLGPYSYKLNLLDVNSVQQANFPIDNLTSNTSTNSTVLASLASTATGQGDNLIGSLGPLTGEIATTQHQINIETPNIFRWMTAAQQADALSNTGSIDSTAAFAAAALATNTLVIPAGTYKVTNLPSINAKGINWIGLGVVVINCTGSGVSVTAPFIGSSTAAWAFGGNTAYDNIHIENITLTGNTSCPIGIFMQQIGESTFKNVKVWGFSSTDFYLSGCWSDTFDNCSATPNGLPGTYTASQYGLFVDEYGTSTSNDITWINFIAEQTTQWGIYLKYATQCHFIGGTCENGAGGIYISTTSGTNTFTQMDLEVNSVNDLTVNGSSTMGCNKFNNITCSSNFPVLITSGFSNYFEGGILLNSTAATISSGVVNTIFIGVNMKNVSDSSGPGQTIIIGCYSSSNLSLNNGMGGNTQSTWTPSNNTITGTISSTTAKYKLTNGVLYYTIRIQGTSLGCTGGTNYISPPSGLAPSVSLGMGVCTAQSNTAEVSLGIGANIATGIYPPTFSSQTDITISGWWFII